MSACGSWKQRCSFVVKIPLRRDHCWQVHVEHWAPGQLHKDSRELIQLGFVENRCEQLSGLLLDSKQSRQWFPGFAGQMWGNLASQGLKDLTVWPRQAQAFYEAAYERGRVGWHTQVLSAINWWLNALRTRYLSKCFPFA